tara:strand:+ start:8688 stop:9461 length:774 start_codon:yes stop_codon:yes gene_type:complete
MINELFITGAGVSADSGIPTFRGNDGFWTIGSVNYTPQEMATRKKFEENPDEFLLWYYKRFAKYKNVKPNSTHKWLADKYLITQNIDGLDGKAGNKNYIPIHGRLDKLITYDDQMKPQTPIDADWNNIEKERPLHRKELIEVLLKKFKIEKSINGRLIPKIGISLKPFVLLFDEYYTDIYRISEAETWMNIADKIIFIGTSFNVNITSIALRTAIQRTIPIEIVDPDPIRIPYDKVKYHRMTSSKYCEFRGQNCELE